MAGIARLSWLEKSMVRLGSAGNELLDKLLNNAAT